MNLPENFAEIDTPAILIDLDVAENNIANFQKLCDKVGIKLRPHIKTHKIPFLAKQQIKAGAIGITCQKISEAEAIISEGGINDVLITYNILGNAKLTRLRKLARQTRLSVIADNNTVINGLSSAFANAPERLRVLVECDTGANRCGAQTPEQAANLAEQIANAPGLTFAGLMTYPPPEAVAEVQDWLQKTRTEIESRNLKVEVVSSGGSPDMWKLAEMNAVNEYRAGTYIYFDRSLQMRNTCQWHNCALTVLTTVVSTPKKHRAIIDAGSKVLTSDLLGAEGHGHILSKPQLTINSLSEEHGQITANTPTQLQVGQRLQIVPNHACVVANMLDEVVLTRGKKITGVAKVTARGQVW